MMEKSLIVILYKYRTVLVFYSINSFHTLMQNVHVYQEFNIFYCILHYIYLVDACQPDY